MNLGICSPYEDARYIEEAGFDYLELALSSIAVMTEEEFRKLIKRIAECSLPTYAFNLFVPATIRLTGNEVKIAIVKEYLVKSLSRAAELGGKIVVFGSGGARNVPDGYPIKDAWRQLVEFLKIAGETAAQYDITIAIEPLRHEETNIINTGEEGLKLAQEVNHPNVRLLIDYYHMTCEKESPDIILKAGKEFIRHIHIANPNGRIFPIEPDESDYKSFFQNLIQISYEGGISIEAGTTKLKEDAPAALRCLSILKKC